MTSVVDGTGVDSTRPPARRRPAARASPLEDPGPWIARHYALLVMAAIVAGLALRIAVSFTDEAPTTDETAYLGSGMSLVAGDGFERGGEPELHFPPVVPVLLGLASEVFADPHTGAVVLTLVSSTALSSARRAGQADRGPDSRHGPGLVVAVGLGSR